MELTSKSSLLRQRVRQHCRVGESTQSLEMPVTDRPDMSKGHINGHGSFSCLSLDTTERDDFLAGRQ